MATIKHILTQGANYSRTSSTRIVSTGVSAPIGALRNAGIDVDNIGAYVNLLDTDVVFPLFHHTDPIFGDTCKLALTTLTEVQGVIAEHVAIIDITTVIVKDVIAEIQQKLTESATDNNHPLIYRVSLSLDRIVIEVDATGAEELLETRVTDSRAIDLQAILLSSSVNDLSNPMRLFDYVYPDSRAVSRVGDPLPGPPREGKVTTPSSIGISQGEARTSASHNRSIDRIVSDLDTTDAIQEYAKYKPETVWLPLTLTTDDINLAIDYSAAQPPAVILSSWNGFDFGVPEPGAQNAPEPYYRSGGMPYYEYPANSTVLAIRGITLHTEHTNNERIQTRIVNRKGDTVGYISPDKYRRGTLHFDNRSSADRGVLFPGEGDRWQFVQYNRTELNGASIYGHRSNDPDIVALDRLTPPNTRWFALPTAVEDKVYPSEQYPYLDSMNTSVGIDTPICKVRLTRIDNVTFELRDAVGTGKPFPVYDGALLRLGVEGEYRYLLIREWLEPDRVIVGEIPKAMLNGGGYYSSLTPADLSDPELDIPWWQVPSNAFLQRGPKIHSQDWLIIVAKDTAGYLSWLEDEELFLEATVIDAPDKIGDRLVIRNPLSTVQPTVRDSAQRLLSPYTRDIADRPLTTLHAVHNASPSGVTVQGSTTEPFDASELKGLLTKQLSDIAQSANIPPIHEEPLGVQYRQVDQSNLQRIIGQVAAEASLADVQYQETDDSFIDGIDQFLYEKLRISEHDVRYPLMRKIAFRFASGLWGSVELDHDRGCLYSSLPLFAGEHVGLVVYATRGFGVPGIGTLVITGVETDKSAYFRYLNKGHALGSGTPPTDVDLYFAPRHEVSYARNGEYIPPAIHIDGIGSAHGAPALELFGARPLEASTELGNAIIDITLDGIGHFVCSAEDHQFGSPVDKVYLHVPVDPDFEFRTIAQVSDRLKPHELASPTSLGGYYVDSAGVETLNGDNEEGENFNVKRCVLNNNQRNPSSLHKTPFIYCLGSPFLKPNAASHSFQEIYVDSSEVVVVLDEIGQFPDHAERRRVQGLLIPVPRSITEAFSTLGIVDAFRTLEVGKLSLRIPMLSISSDDAYLANSSLYKGKLYGDYEAVSLENNLATFETRFQGGHDSTTNSRPHTEISIEDTRRVNYAAVDTKASIASSHTYPASDLEDNTVTKAQLTLDHGRGSGIVARASTWFKPSDASYTSNLDPNITASEGARQASLTHKGLYSTDSIAQCADLDGATLETGFDHRSIEGDLVVTNEKVTELSKHLDSLQHQNHGLLKQLSLQGAMLHSALDMLRSAQNSIMSLRNMQYEVIMALFGVMDEAQGYGHNANLRFALNANGNTVQRLGAASLYAGHIKASGLAEQTTDPNSVPDDFMFQKAWVSAEADFTESIPLSYSRPGYTRVTVENSTNKTLETEPLDPLVPVVNASGGSPTVMAGESRGLYPLYASQTWEGREHLAKESISWQSALNEFGQLMVHATTSATQDFKSLVCRVSPMFSFRPRAEFADPESLSSSRTSYLLGIGYWSPFSAPFGMAIKYGDDKVTHNAAGWSMINSSHRAVGPAVSAYHSDIHYSIETTRAALSAAFEYAGDNSGLYDDSYLIDRLAEGKDLVYGVRLNGGGSVNVAPLLGYSQLYATGRVVSDVETYATFDEAAVGDALFYTVTESFRPVPIVPTMYKVSAENQTSLVGLDNIYSLRVANYDGTYPAVDTMTDASIPDAWVAGDTTREVVYIRAWQIARETTEALLEAKVILLGYTGLSDIRIRHFIHPNVDDPIKGSHFAVRSRVGMAELLRTSYDLPASSGQVTFSFKTPRAGAYVQVDNTIKTSESL